MKTHRTRLEEWKGVGRELVGLARSLWRPREGGADDALPFADEETERWRETVAGVGDAYRAAGSRIVMPMTRAEVEALDPGVRLVVLLLRAWGFETCDSGDGVSKPGAGVEDERGVMEVLPYPHVIARLDYAHELAERFEELRALLAAAGVRVDCDAPHGPMLQGAVTYSAADGAKAFVELVNVTDADLPAPLRDWLNVRDWLAAHEASR